MTNKEKGSFSGGLTQGKNGVWEIDLWVKAENFEDVERDFMKVLERVLAELNFVSLPSFGATPEGSELKVTIVPQSAVDQSHSLLFTVIMSNRLMEMGYRLRTKEGDLSYPLPAQPG